MGPTAPEGCLARPDGWNGRPLDTARLILRAPRPEDVPRFVELLADPEVVRHTARVPHPYTTADGEGFVAAAAEERAARLGVTLAIEERVSGQVVGCIGAPFAPGNAEIGYWLGKPFWNRGYATEAARRLLRALFQDCGRGLVWGSPEPANPASRRVLEKAGLIFAQRERMDFPARGGEREVEVMTIDRERWLALHTARPRALVAAAALIDIDGRVLLAQRPAGKSMAGLWEFPGGKLDAANLGSRAGARAGRGTGHRHHRELPALIGFASHTTTTRSIC